MFTIQRAGQFDRATIFGAVKMVSRLSWVGKAYERLLTSVDDCL